MFGVASKTVSFLVSYKLQAARLILIPNKNKTILAARFVPCIVAFLDHISPLCSAESATPGANLSRKSLSTFYRVSVQIRRKFFRPQFLRGFDQVYCVLYSYLFVYSIRDIKPILYNLRSEAQLPYSKINGISCTTIG